MKINGLNIILTTLSILTTSSVMAGPASCEDNFVVNRQNGMVDYQATVLLTSANEHDISQQIKQAIAQSGFRIDSEETTRSGTEITFLPNKQARDAWLAMTAVVTKTENQHMVGLRSLGDSSLKQQSTPQMRTAMCGFLASLPSAKSSNMVAAQTSSGRGAPPATKNIGREIRPKSELDVRVAQLALEPGAATIMGKACTTNRSHGQTFRDYLRNEAVFLYPVTPYLEEILSLYEKSRPEDTVIISPLITQMRIEGRTNSDGEFRFSQLKPGKYLIVAEHASAGAGSYMNYDGANTSQNGNTITTTHFYSERDFFRNWNDILKDRVTISKPDQIVKISLTPPFRAQGLIGGLINRGKQKGTGVMGLSCSEWQFK